MNLHQFTSSLCLALTGLLSMSMAQVSGTAKEITSLGIPGRFFLVELNYSWGRARLYCKTTYQDLAEIPPKVLSPKMKSTKAWIGMSRSMDSLDWLWVSGQTANITQAGLAKDTDYYPDCMALTSQGTWEKTTCAQQNNFICMDNDPPSTKAPNPTKETTTPAVSSRLSFVELNYTWGRARQHCKSNNLDLAELPPAVTDPKMKWTKAWIGLSRPMDSLDWLWVSGQTANITRAGLAKDTDYYPDCMALTSQGTWEKTTCAQQNYFICMNNANANTKSTVRPFLGPSTLTGQNYNGNNLSSVPVGGVTADPKAVTSQTKQGNWNTTRNGNAGGKTVAPSQNMTANISVLNLLSKATCVVSPVTGLLTVAVVFASSVVKFS